MASLDTEDLPRANVKRIVKSKLTELSSKLVDEEGKKKDVQINKDTLLAFCESAKIFVHYISASANEICQENKRQTINAEDVITAVEDLDFPEFVEPLRAVLEAFRKENQTKKSENKGKKPGKKRKADEVEGDKVEGEADANMESRERLGSRTTDAAEDAEPADEQEENGAAEDSFGDKHLRQGQAAGGSRAGPGLTRDGMDTGSDGVPIGGPEISSPDDAHVASGPGEHINDSMHDDKAEAGEDAAAEERASLVRAENVGDGEH